MIIRRRHTRNFTTISNVLFDDERLAADEVGILAYLLSRPDNWEIRRPALGRRWGIGSVAIKRIVRSWMKAGWCQATKVRLPNGTFCILYDISDIPGVEMTEEEVREALSLVSSEASADDPDHVPDGDHHPHVSDDPPPCQPVVVDQRGGDDGVVIRDITKTQQPRDESYQNSERELARAREKHALNLAEFKRRYPTAPSDDQAKIDEEWFRLDFAEAEAALSGITPFLARLKADKRTTVPAAWKYLRDKRWTLLEQAAADSAAAGIFAKDSPEARAIIILHDIAMVGEFARRVYRQADGSIVFRGKVDDRLRALAQAPRPDEWVTLNRQQAAAWESFLRDHVSVNRPRRMAEGSRAPWPWPPKSDGSLYTSATGPPETLMSEQDEADFK